MQDEYGELNSEGNTHIFSEGFVLESGVHLHPIQVTYNTYGNLNSSKDNVIVICHALTANSKVDSWWSYMLGNGEVLDTSKYFIICCNVLGSCYGSTGPRSINPSTQCEYGIDFPNVTIRDSVNVHMKLLTQVLQIKSVLCVIGGSMGGMQALEWSLLSPPNFLKSACIIACNLRHTAWQIGMSELQRQAIYSDNNWQNGRFNELNPPIEGLSLARQIAMMSYRSPQSYEKKFGRETRDDDKNLFQVQSYLDHQGMKFVKRFDALSYITLTKSLDSHDITSYFSRKQQTINQVLQRIHCKVLVIGINSDLLYPLYEQEEIAKHIPSAKFCVMESEEGHDAFLLEKDLSKQLIYQFLSTI